jgi:hypothetical protein
MADMPFTHPRVIPAKVGTSVFDAAPQMEGLDRRLDLREKA